MMNKFLWFLLACFIFCASAQADDGMVTLKSHHSVSATADRLENLLRQKGMVVFSRINHAKGAQKMGMKLRPTELLLFGNPKVGTPLMQCEQRVAIDLPQKALIFEDETGQVWLSYNSPRYLSRRHRMKGCEPVLQKVEKALENFARESTKP